MSKRSGIAVILSPYRSDDPTEFRKFREYRHNCIRHATERGYAPYASHQMMTDSYDDRIPEERRKGMQCERAFLEIADAVLVYIDEGISGGMLETLNSLPDSAPHPTFIRLLGGQS